MPWHVDRDHAGCPASKPWAVVKDSDGSVAGCHATEDDAMSQMAALYANDRSLDRDVFGHERRTLALVEIEVRKNDDDDTRRLHGYAAVFDRRASISGFGGPFIESVAPGAFKKSIDEHDVKLLFNHDPSLILARNQAGTLRLQEDQRGLRVDADLPETTTGRDIAISLARGDISQMSFAFDAIRDEWNYQADPPERRLLEVRLYDVSVVTNPAYADTTASVRALRSMGVGDAFIRAIQQRSQQRPQPADRHAGDEPPDGEHETTPATSHLVSHERRLRVLSVMYDLELGEMADVQSG
jgi:HK97 family phage prohead protease